MATSSIAPHVKLFALRTFLLVVLNDRSAAASMMTISMIEAHERVTPSQKLMPFANTGNFIGRTPLSITAPTIMTRNMILCAPLSLTGFFVSLSNTGCTRPSAISFLYALVSRKKNTVRSMIRFTPITFARRRLQKKSTPFINPIRSGGSPTGVRHPPIFDTRKMKKTMICTFLRLHLFALMIGRIMSILAPVVPIQLERSVPISRRITLSFGVPARSPSSDILPATQKSAKSNTMKVR